MKKSRIYGLLIFTALALVLASCAFFGLQLDSLTLNQSSASLAIGDAATLTATYSPDNYIYQELTWSTSDAAVATVDIAGKVTAVGFGNAVITATAAKETSKSATCAVKVTNPSGLVGTWSVVVSGNTLSIVIGSDESCEVKTMSGTTQISGAKGTIRLNPVSGMAVISMGQVFDTTLTPPAYRPMQSSDSVSSMEITMCYSSTKLVYGCFVGGNAATFIGTWLLSIKGYNAATPPVLSQEMVLSLVLAADGTGTRTTTTMSGGQPLTQGPTSITWSVDTAAKTLTIDGSASTYEIVGNGFCFTGSSGFMPAFIKQ